MANERNLKPFTGSQSHEEAVKNGRKGGIVSGQNRRERATLRRELEELLCRKITNEDGKRITVQEAISMALVKRAIKGDVRAFETIRDTIGEKPVADVALHPEPDFSALDAVLDALRFSAE